MLVKAEIGAIRGIKKGFLDISPYTFEDCINTPRITSKSINTDTFTNGKYLFGRQPQIIDLQKCFCETDKYLRLKCLNC